MASLCWRALILGEERLATEAVASLAARSASTGLPRIGAGGDAMRRTRRRRCRRFGSSVAAYATISRPYEFAQACEATGSTLGKGGSREKSIAYGRENIEF
jgi:hypothetical protein